jgi:hypothetical protein
MVSGSNTRPAFLSSSDVVTDMVITVLHTQFWTTLLCTTVRSEAKKRSLDILVKLRNCKLLAKLELKLGAT